MTPEAVRRKVAGFARAIREGRGSRGDTLVRLADRAIHSAHLDGYASVARCSIVELNTPPPRPKGLRDLLVRRATRDDASALAEVDSTGLGLVHARLDRGDLAYVGLLDGQALCHTWLHRGPAPFDEDRGVFARWGLGPDAFWSYHGVARPEARSSGAWVKLFQTALRDVFEEHGAARVRGFIHRSNTASLAVHARLGFAVVEDVTAIGVPGLKWVRWECGAEARQFVTRRSGELTLPPGTRRA